MSENNTVAPVEAPKRALTIRDNLESPAFLDQVKKALPKHLTPERFIRVAVTAMNKTPKLRDCDQGSFFNALLNLSQLGLEPDGRNAHLIPYENRKRGIVECQLIIDYKGLVELVMRSGLVSYVHADVVCENDVFGYDRGQLKEHKIDFRKPRGAAYAFYAICRFKDGSEKCEVMTMEDVQAIRARSKAGQSGPWVNDFTEMAKKGLALDTIIPTPNGWTTMEQIKAGDVVFDMHGLPVRVSAVSEIKQLPCFKVTFANGDEFICDDEHRWVACIGQNDKRNSVKNGWHVKTINELLDAKNRDEMVTVPVAEPIQTEHANVPIHPWLLGYWLGNGKSNDGNITCHEDDVNDVVNLIQQCGFKTGAIRKDKDSKAFSVGIKGLRVALRSAGLLHNKHVPGYYLRSSVAQRISLLRGLMDSDGCIEKNRGRGIFSSTNKGLADSVYEILASLGQVCNYNSRIQFGFGKYVECFYVRWQSTFNPCLVSRKAIKWKPRKWPIYRGIKSIEPVDSVLTKCIAVDSPTSTYLVGRSMIPTHNTVFRRLSKWLPISSEFRDALDKDGDVLEEKRVENAVKVQFASVQTVPEPVVEAEPVCDNDGGAA